MGTYTNTKCGQCGFSFSGGYTSGSSTFNDLGFPKLRCPKCKMVNNTGKKVFSMMNSTEKFFLLLFRTIGSLFYIAGFAGLFFIIAVISGLSEEALNTTYVIVPIIAAATVLGALCTFLGTRSEIRKIEKAYKDKDPNFYADA